MQSFVNKIVASEKETWLSKTILTIDTDWACDEILEDTFNLIARYSVPSTWFVTHDSPFIRELMQDDRVEIGIHPNFNRLLDGSDVGSDADSIVEKLLDIAPDAKSVRSHSLVCSERLLYTFHKYELSHVSNSFIPYSSGVQVAPFETICGLTQVPHVFQDNLSLVMDLRFPDSAQMLSDFTVMDFHPIHIFLNTENLDRYEKTRQFHFDPKKLFDHRYAGTGIRNKFLTLLQSAVSS